MFGNVGANKRLNRFTWRDQTEVDGQWKLFAPCTTSRRGRTAARPREKAPAAHRATWNTCQLRQLNQAIGKLNSWKPALSMRRHCPVTSLAVYPSAKRPFLHSLKAGTIASA